MQRLQLFGLLSTALLVSFSPAALAHPGCPVEEEPGEVRVIDSSWVITDEGHLQRGRHYAHTFQGEVNQQVTISAESWHFDAYLELYDTDGRLLAENDDAYGMGNSRVQVTIPQSGTYTVVVRGFSDNAEGPFSVRIEGGRIAQLPPLPYFPR